MELAKRFESLGKLREKLAESPHILRPTTDLFASIDVEKVANDLALDEAAEENGRTNNPPASAKGLDATERAVAEQIQDEQKAAHQTTEDYLQLFSDRMTALDIDEQFGLIRQANAASVTDFKAVVTVALDDLHGLRRALNTAETEYDWFRSQHGIVRAARVSSVFWLYVKWAFIVLLLFLETALNGTFLSVGSDQGMIGGLSLALGFSVVNIGGALLISTFWANQILHRNWFRKLLGFAGCVAYAVFAGTINLGLAHVRDLSGQPGFDGDVGIAAMNHIWSSPFALDSMESWLLAVIGIIFSLLAFIDGFYIKDPYPGYSGVQKRLNSRRDEYISAKEAAIDELRGIRDEHNEKVEEIVKALSRSQREYRAIVDHRARILSLFKAHQDQLEKAGNTLLKRYRDTNKKARETATPKYFATHWKLPRIEPRKAGDGEWNDKELAEGIRAAQEELKEQMKEIGRECEVGITQYRELDAIHADKVHG